MGSYRRKYKIPPPEPVVRTFGSRPGAKLAAFRERVAARKKAKARSNDDGTQGRI
jgi:hypothetical protein